MSIKGDIIAVTIAGAVLLAAAWYAKKKLVGVAADVKQVAIQAWDAVAEVADPAVAAPVYLIGDAIGLPRTNMTECERAKAEGRKFDASLKCEAWDFVKWMASSESDTYDFGVTGGW